jgi:nicotinamide riboside transporter PnuC
MMKQHWPDDDVMVKLLDLYKRRKAEAPGESFGWIQWLYSTGEESEVSPEAVVKAIMSLMEDRAALVVDVVNGVILVQSAIFEFAVTTGNERLFTDVGFRDLIKLLKDQGMPVHVIEVRKNGSIKYLD